MKIMVIDDNRRHLEAAEALRQAGHEIELFDDYGSAVERLDKEPFDVLLTDRSMPAEEHCLGPKGLEHLGHPVDIGFVLLINAAQNGVKYGAMITDASHHDDPMSAAIDWVKLKPVKINQMFAIITHAPMKNGVKDWQKVLGWLLEVGGE